MTRTKTITAEQLRQALHYDPLSGEFTWLVSRTGRVPVGSTAGTRNHRGRIFISLGRRTYQASRLAWLYVHGEWPPNLIDHINGNTSDNRIANLRPATFAQNAQNRRRQATTRNGFKGVNLTPSGKWRAQIKVDGRSLHLGVFDTAEEAGAAYADAAVAWFGAFAKAA